MATTSPARIDDELYASAKLAGDVQSRSASQQVAHWARIGREIEASASISHKEIAEVLAGSRSYDTLDAKEQAVVRAEWTARMDGLRETLNFAAQFGVEGRSWVELDDEGSVVERTGTRPDAAAARRVVRKAAKARKTGNAVRSGKPDTAGKGGTTRKAARGAGARSKG
jgi:ParD-like antitoxin of type II ParDE toxin-antitoxin system